VFDSCASTPPQPGAPAAPRSVALDRPRTRGARGIQPLVKQHSGLSGFDIMCNGINGLAARLLLMHKAERSIDVQYYLLHADMTGYVFLEQRLLAADRGVRVRVLLDDITTAGHDAGLAALEDVVIVSPYVVPLDSGVDCFRQLRARDQGGDRHQLAQRHRRAGRARRLCRISARATGVGRGIVGSPR